MQVNLAFCGIVPFCRIDHRTSVRINYLLRKDTPDLNKPKVACRRCIQVG